MGHYEKRMIALILFLFLGLLVKSVWIDPVKPENNDLMHYSQYAQLAAPFQSGAMIEGWQLYTYRTVFVEQVTTEGETLILYRDPVTEEMREAVLPGQYQARVRGYLLSIFPAKQVRVEGGLSDDGSDTQN